MSGSGRDESGNAHQPRRIKSVERSESNGEHLAMKAESLSINDVHTATRN